MGLKDQEKKYAEVKWELQDKELEERGFKAVSDVVQLCVGFNPSGHDLQVGQLSTLIEELLTQSKADKRVSATIILYENQYNLPAVAQWKEKNKEALAKAGDQVISILKWREQHAKEVAAAKDIFNQVYAFGTDLGKEMDRQITITAEPFWHRRERDKQSNKKKKTQEEMFSFNEQQAYDHVKQETIDCLALAMVNPEALTVLMHLGKKWGKIFPAGDYLIKTFPFGEHSTGRLDELGYEITPKKPEYFMKREERMKSRSGSEENGNNSDKSDQANLVSVEPTITKVKDIAEEEPMSVSGSSSSEDEEIVEVSDLKEKNNDIEMQVEVEQNNNSLEEGQEMMGRNNADKEGGKIKIPVTGQVYINPAEFFMETQQLELKLGIPVDSQKAGEFYGASYAAFFKKNNE